MRQKSMSKNDPAERTVRDIRRKTRKQYTAEEKIRIVVSGLRGSAVNGGVKMYQRGGVKMYCGLGFRLSP